MPTIDALGRSRTERSSTEAARRRAGRRTRSPGYLDLATLPPGQAVTIRPAGRTERVLCRAGEAVAGLALLLLARPAMLAVAALVRLDSKGPAIYRQQRLGLGGRPFTMLKFRSMHVDAEAAGPAWAGRRDPRVTRVGAFLRRTRLDELPQLWNVLRGDMAVIGPRPERAFFVEQLARQIPHFRARMLVKPGLTGWAQVNFRYGASVEDARVKAGYDLFYIQNRSARMNARIVLATLGVMIRREGR